MNNSCYLVRYKYKRCPRSIWNLPNVSHFLCAAKAVFKDLDTSDGRKLRKRAANQIAKAPAAKKTAAKGKAKVTTCFFVPNFILPFVVRVNVRNNINIVYNKDAWLC